MFNKILIANRGEIACRIIETAHKLGIKTVAIYSDADAHSKHVDMADEAWRIGPPAVAESYLRGDKIIEVALASGAEAIHPGYGFLSESPDFVENVEKSGLRFVGPSSSAIRAMGLKDAAKSLMAKSGVPVVPGYHESNQDADFLKKEAGKIGYPVLIKARAGGGGKGMRKVDSAEDFLPALEGAQREGLSSFGDAHCLIEKWITSPRHIEIQIFGDDHANVVHLFERDCSLQRRHQKVIEEAPAPGMTDEMRTAMGDAAVLCAKSIGYSGAGTVEFIVDGSEGLSPDKFWFMEMNTRLQVEHPVTEMITGVDLVEWQFRVANGEKLPTDQTSLKVNGHAFEARIYAEDVPAGFLPVTGSIDYLSFPDSARVDGGIRQGDQITPWYDPMISKVIVHGTTRSNALQQLITGLSSCKIGGLTTNIPFLGALCENDDFAAGNVGTDLIDQHLDSLIASTNQPAKDIDWTVAALLALNLSPGDDLFGWNMWSSMKRSVYIRSDGFSKEVLIDVLGGASFDVSFNGVLANIQIHSTCENTLTISNLGLRQKISYSRTDDRITIFGSGSPQTFEIERNYVQGDGAEQGSNQITSPMPGLVKVVNVTNDEKVAEGDIVVIIEAMKMEHSLTAQISGSVCEVLVKEGQQVDVGQVLVVLDNADE